MTSPPSNLGKFESVEVRSIWANEAADFTPWLASHIEMISSAIGIDLELSEIEVSVGEFSADIVAQEVGSGSACGRI